MVKRLEIKFCFRYQLSYMHTFVKKYRQRKKREKDHSNPGLKFKIPFLPNSLAPSSILLCRQE